MVRTMLAASLCSSSMTSGLGSGRVEEAWVSTKAVLLAANTTPGRDVATGLHTPSTTVDAARQHRRYSHLGVMVGGDESYLGVRPMAGLMVMVACGGCGFLRFSSMPQAAWLLL